MIKFSLSKINWTYGIAILAACVACFNLGWFDYEVVQAPAEIQVQYIPDDAYYYLTLSKNFVKFGQWTFDGGISTASGYHFLWAYFLVFLVTVFSPSPDQFVCMAVMASACMIGITLVAGFYYGYRKKSPIPFLVIALVVNGWNFVLNSVSALEWSGGILGVALYFFCFERIFESNKKINYVFLLMAGLLGSLMRSDFGITPLVFLGGAILLRLLRRDATLIGAALCGMGGAIFGVGIVLFNNLIFTGSFVQSSALIKSYWGALFPDYQLPLALVFQIIGLPLEFYPVLGGGLMVMVFMAVVPFKASAARTPDLSVKLKFFGGVSLGVLVFYFLSYAQIGGVSWWYTGQLLLPTAIIIGLLIDLIFIISSRRVKFIPVLLTVSILFLSIQRITEHTSVWQRTRPYAHQVDMLRMGRFLASHPWDGRIGAWNAGIIGYYQGGRVVNLDGLVNNQIYPFIIQQNAEQYLSDNQICYIADFTTMFEENFPVKGGYGDLLILNSLESVQIFRNHYGFWHDMSLFRYRKGCFQP